MNRVFVVAATVLLAAGLQPAEAVAENQCEACHGQTRFIAQNPVLYEYFQDWLRSPHKNAGITCEACHGGDPTATDKEEAHKGILPAEDPRSKVNYLNQPATCGACHQDIVERQRNSAHYKALREDKAAPSCATCHRAMNKRPFYGSIIQTQCLGCHGEGEHKVDGATPEQVALAREILHRLHVAKAYLGWTTVYFESRSWPGDSREMVAELRSEYHDVVLKGHGLDLAGSSDASLKLLANLKDIFTKAWGEEVPPLPGGAPEP
jgi:hypothetical protein